MRPLSLVNPPTGGKFPNGRNKRWPVRAYGSIDCEALPMAPWGRRETEQTSRQALIAVEMLSLKLSVWKHKTACNTSASHSRVHLCSALPHCPTHRGHGRKPQRPWCPLCQLWRTQTADCRCYYHHYWGFPTKSGLFVFSKSGYLLQTINLKPVWQRRKSFWENCRQCGLRIIPQSPDVDSENTRWCHSFIFRFW